MIYGSLITGIILILTGLIARYNSDLIAGYNTLSQEKKAKIDTDKLTRITQKYMVLTGLSVISIGTILFFFNIDEKTQSYVLMSLVGIGITMLIVQSNRLKPKN
ncbi:DUF3784 domain-containing protein [Flavobacteriaceae bacterium]|nr:DUF3784 domain-containing protein [Flavobacteriaceae bacterium]